MWSACTFSSALRTAHFDPNGISVLAHNRPILCPARFQRTYFFFGWVWAEEGRSRSIEDFQLTISGPRLAQPRGEPRAPGKGVDSVRIFLCPGLAYRSRTRTWGTKRRFHESAQSSETRTGEGTRRLEMEQFPALCFGGERSAGDRIGVDGQRS